MPIKDEDLPVGDEVDTVRYGRSEGTATLFDDLPVAPGTSVPVEPITEGSEATKYGSGDQAFETVDEALARTLLQRQMAAGYEVHDLPEHMKDTPRRFVAMLGEMTYREDFNFTTFSSDSDDMVVLEKIPFYTLCAHHVVPFFGYAYIGYIPAGEIAGLSKFVRAVQYCAKGFHVQEDLTRDIVFFLENNLHTTDLAVVLRAEHMCMMMRGAKAPGVMTTTSRMIGVFGDHTRTAKTEFMSIIKESW